ncbi:MAG: LysM peptidoglycan-binding domain-containing protein [Pseudomonadota bacterium]
MSKDRLRYDSPGLIHFRRYTGTVDRMVCLAPRIKRVRRFLEKLALLKVVLAVSACTTVSPPGTGPADPEPLERPEAVVKADPYDVRIDPSKLPLVRPDQDLWLRVRRQLRFEVPDHPEVQRAVAQLRKQRRFAELITPRAKRYLYYLVTEVERRGLPMDLALLPLVESSLDPFAYSYQRAAGLWQFMPATADELGMRRDWWFDARLDVRESTRYALDLLSDYHSEFGGDWYLALAAYNGGKYRVRRAIARNKERGEPTTYWALSLPRETRRYVPRLLAIASLLSEGDSAFDLPPIPNQPAFSAVSTGGQIELLRIADIGGMSLNELRSYNPGQLRWATAPRGSGEILVPIEYAARTRKALEQLPQEERVTWEHYRIRSGDSLIRIARKFDTQVGLLREVNNLRGNLIRAGDTLMIPNNEAWRESLSLSREERRGIERRYRVRNGDSLYTIARRFNLDMADLISWNKLDPGRYLQPGQSLTLYLREG